MSGRRMPAAGAGRRLLLRAALGSAALAAFAGCERRAGLHIGLLASLSGRGSSLGESGRNGVMVAIEQRNADGGVGGQPVRLTIEDDAAGSDQGRTAFERLASAGVDAVIGPYTSTVAQAVLPLADQRGLLLVSPTASSLALYGKDDHMVRINRTTRDNATDYAKVLQRAGLRRAAVALDMSNPSFSQSWLDEFRRAHEALGGQTLEPQPFESAVATSMSTLDERLVALQPDVVVLVASAVDAARLAQRVRQRAPALALAAAEWAATGTLIDLGGQAIDGLMVLLPHDQDDLSPRYRAFVQAYQRRFGDEPSYGAVASYDACTVVMTAAQQRQGGQSMKAAVLASGPYPGLQQDIVFDRNGDTQRKGLFTEVRDGRYRPLPP